MLYDSTWGDYFPIEISSRNAHSDCAYHCFTIQQQTKSIIKRTVSKPDARIGSRTTTYANIQPSNWQNAQCVDEFQSDDDDEELMFIKN